MEFSNFLLDPFGFFSVGKVLLYCSFRECTTPTQYITVAKEIYFEIPH